MQMIFGRQDADRTQDMTSVTFPINKITDEEIVENFKHFLQMCGRKTANVQYLTDDQLAKLKLIE